MIPTLSKGIDHVHLYTKDREAAAAWYAEKLGFAPVEEFAFWAEDPKGPLTIANGSIHFALFTHDRAQPFSLAFGTTGREYLEWRAYLAEAGIAARESDHDKSWSLYFTDPDGNTIEITTYDYAQIKNAQ